MATQKIVVLISGSGTNLQAIIDKLHKQPLGDLETEIVAVISNKPMFMVCNVLTMLK